MNATRRTRFDAENTVFVILSFEGPDPYSLAGGLGVRVAGLSQALAGHGYNTHLFFVGDPGRDGHEIRGRLELHRWCQWISQHHPSGVYDGEIGKLYDYQESIPWFVADQVVRPALEQKKTVVIMGEEWHTAEAMCRLSDLLYGQGARDKVLMLWNANNTFGFDRINWRRLSCATTITTVSRYMKHIMWRQGVNPVVIPNGIPERLLDSVDTDASARLRRSLKADVLLTKIARWDPDKRWNAAVEATARLKRRGLRTVLLARGGIEPHGQEVLDKARYCGLNIRDVHTSGRSPDSVLDALGDAGGADVLNIRFHCPPQVLQTMYHASDAVLANSGHEPFGLVGLEAMASGGVAFTGGTGEDYAIHLHNSVVLETSDPEEIETSVVYLNDHPQASQAIRKAARGTARRFTWEEVMENIVQKLAFQATSQGMLAPRKAAGAKPQSVRPDARLDRARVLVGTA